MADASTAVTRTPRPPRAPASAGVRSIGSEGNDLLLGAHRKNMLTKKASSIAESDSAKSGLQAEVEALKRQLKDSEKRLTTPQKASSRRPRESMQAQSLTLQGERYNETPYKPVQPRIMWEPFEEDPEVRAELDRLRESEQRISRRHETWSHEWSRLDRDRSAKIDAPVPAVLTARDEDAVMELAAKAEIFAASGGKPSPKKADGSRQDAAERYARTYSPAGTSHSQSRNGSRAGSRANRRTSSIHPASAHVLQSFGLQDAVDIVLPDPEDVVSEREGDILGGEFVLKRDLFDAAFARKDVSSVMGGAPGFRMIPRFNVGAVSQAHLSGIKTILNELTKQWDGPIVWVNLREEPIVYINNRSYIVRAASNPREPMSTPGIKAGRLEELEEKLRQEVMREGQRFGGNVIVHKETATEDMEAQWEAVDDATVHSLASAFRNTVSTGYDIRYVRLPVTPHQGVSREQMDVMFDLCERFPSDPIIANCQTGRGRSTVAMIMCTIVRFYQHALYKNDAGHTRHVSMLAREETADGFRSLAQLVALLPNGHVHERRVSMMCELTGKASNLTDRILAALKTTTTAAGIGLLSRYCHLVAFSAYCEARLQDKSVDCSFSQWLRQNQLIDVLLLTLESPDFDRSISPGAGSPSNAAAAAEQSTGSRRVGEILLPGMCLVAMKAASGATEAVPGVEGLRQVHMSVPIFTCGRNTGAGCESLLYNASEQHIAASKIVWVDTRAEPHVYVNGAAYFVAGAKNVFKQNENQMNVTGAAIEDVEKRLKDDVIAELQAAGGVVEVVEADASSRLTTPTTVRVSDIKTPAEHAAQLTAPKDIVYHRIPVATAAGFSPLSIQPLLDIAAKEDDKLIMVVEGTTGGLGTTLAVNVLCLARLSKQTPLNACTNIDAIVAGLAVNEFAQPITTNRCFGGKAEEDSIDEAAIIKELMIAANLGQMLAAGGVLMATEAVCDACGRGSEWNLVDRCNFFISDMKSNVGKGRESATRKAVATATMYMHVYLSAVYVSESARDASVAKFGFDAWMRSLPEISLLIEKLRDHPAANLKFVKPENLFLDTDRGPVVRRRGNVLTSNYGMKADHFPGAIRKDMVPRIPGVPNYRKVPDVNVYGVGIPTRRGIHNLLRVLGAEDEPVDLCGDESLDPQIIPTHAHRHLFHAGEGPVDPAPRGRVIWFNMREEPLLYVGDRPFVLRDLANPYVNVELTGITPAKIVAIEDALRQDCLDDAAKYNNQFLIHDEITPGNMGGLWEPGTPDQIITLRDIYAEAVSAGARVTFVRLPVTDEQMPEIRDFDILIQELLPDIIDSIEAKEPEEALSLVFNCQMGRGRTTTGMVVACMLIGLVDPAYYDQLRKSYPELYPEDADKFENGHFSVITDLIRTLVDGRDAKLRVDHILEACDKMQNLRTAINVFKKQYESPDTSESGRARALHHGQHYLVRYFFLIVINSYLHESWDSEARRLSCTFEQYMEPRAELRHFASRVALK